MVSRNSPNLKSSMIDLLLGALGGIALLVVVFFAMQRINADENPTKTKKLLFISVVDAPEDWEIGDEFCLRLKDSSGEICYQLPGKLTTSGPLQVEWDDRKVAMKQSTDATQKPNDPPYVVSIAYDANATLSLGVWVHGINSPTSDELVTESYFEQLTVFRSKSSLKFKLSANWSDSESQSYQFELEPSNGFYDSAEIVK